MRALMLILAEQQFAGEARAAYYMHMALARSCGIQVKWQISSFQARLIQVTRAVSIWSCPCDEGLKKARGVSELNVRESGFSS